MKVLERKALKSKAQALQLSTKGTKRDIKNRLEEAGAERQNTQTREAESGRPV